MTAPKQALPDLEAMPMPELEKEFLMRLTFSQARGIEALLALCAANRAGFPMALLVGVLWGNVTAPWIEPWMQLAFALAVGPFLIWQSWHRLNESQTIARDRDAAMADAKPFLDEIGRRAKAGATIN